MTDQSDDERRDEVLKRLLQTPPKKQAQLKKELKEQRQPARDRAKRPGGKP